MKGSKHDTHVAAFEAAAALADSHYIQGLLAPQHGDDYFGSAVALQAQHWMNYRTAWAQDHPDDAIHQTSDAIARKYAEQSTGIFYAFAHLERFRRSTRQSSRHQPRPTDFEHDVIVRSCAHIVADWYSGHLALQGSLPTCETVEDIRTSGTSIEVRWPAGAYTIAVHAERIRRETAYRLGATPLNHATPAPVAPVEFRMSRGEPVMHGPNAPHMFDLLSLVDKLPVPRDHPRVFEPNTNR